jgi:putative endonuclease
MMGPVWLLLCFREGGMMSDDPRQQLGKSGEDVACDELRRRGYAILARRFRTRAGELDIVARDGSTLVFVEVKARRSVRYGTASEAVSWHKRQRITRMAEEFVNRSRLDRVPCRFDVVAVLWPRIGDPSVEVYPSAFDAGD